MGVTFWPVFGGVTFDFMGVIFDFMGVTFMAVFLGVTVDFMAVFMAVFMGVTFVAFMGVIGAVFMGVTFVAFMGVSFVAFMTFLFLGGLTGSSCWTWCNISQSSPEIPIGRIKGGAKSQRDCPSKPSKSSASVQIPMSPATLLKALGRSTSHTSEPGLLPLSASALVAVALLGVLWTPPSPSPSPSAD